MKKATLLLVLMVAAQLAAQEKSNVTVKSAETNNGVVIVTATPEQGKASFALQCNKGAPACKAPEPGSYIMVRLPRIGVRTTAPTSTCIRARRTRLRLRRLASTA